MRVELIKQTTIRNSAEILTGKKHSFDGFINKIRVADWDNPNDIISTFNSVDIIGDDRVIFNLKGNKFRMICTFKFIREIESPWIALYVRWIGSHDEYDKLCKNERQFSI